MAARFNPMTLSTLLGEGVPEVEWLWEPFIPAKRNTLLSAYLKAGKSTMIYALLVAMSKGQPFMGYPTTKTKILILAVEEHREDVARRFASYGMVEDAPEAHDIMLHIGALEGHPTPELENYIKANGIGLVVIETVFRLIQVQDENDNAQVQTALDPWLRLGERNNVGLLIVHHNNKGETHDVRALRGASAYGAMVDQIIIMWKHGDDSSRLRKLVIDGRYPQSPKEFICEYGEDMEYKPIGTNKEALTEIVRSEIKILLSDGIPRSREEISHGIKRKEGNIIKALTPLPDWCARTGAGRRNDRYIYSIKKEAISITQLPQHRQPMPHL